jgi:tetratricopeptide (TPR) repeat protein
MVSWAKIIDELNCYHEKNPSNEILFSIVQAQYGYIGYLIGAGQNRLAREYLKVAEENVDKLLQNQPQNADALAIKASLIAYNVALSPYKAPILGPRSVSLINEAYRLKNSSIQALIEKGNSLHYAPKFFGGDPEEAVSYYIKAIIAFENQNNGVGLQSWLYLNTLAQLALAYEKSKQPQRALKTYREILTIEPDFKWVKDDLYPQLLKINKKATNIK